MKKLQREEKKVTHLDESGRAKMVDVTAKATTLREAKAEGLVRMKPETLQRIREGEIEKGDVLAVAQVAGIMAAKKTSNLIPMCHPLGITGAKMDFDFPDDVTLRIEATVRCAERTGVEMEALTAVAVAALTIYDMCKAIDRGMAIDAIALLEKSGGKSGLYLRSEEGH